MNWYELDGKHTGETCLIIGNGPSLKDVPLDFLKKNTLFSLCCPCATMNGAPT